jgi:hypothetical protein
LISVFFTCFCTFAQTAHPLKKYSFQCRFFDVGRNALDASITALIFELSIPASKDREQKGTSGSANDLQVHGIRK